MRQSGFTVIELVIATAFLVFAGVLFWTQKNNLETTYRDSYRKTSINAMHFSLEESYFKENGHYPAEINESNLTTMDKDLFIDPNGVKLGQISKEVDGEIIPLQSDYRYEPTNCSEGKCKSYTLRADLQGEADFIKTNR